MADIEVQYQGYDHAIDAYIDSIVGHDYRSGSGYCGSGIRDLVYGQVPDEALPRIKSILRADGFTVVTRPAAITGPKPIGKRAA